MLNDIEEEIVVLKAIKELIDSIVNFEVLRIGDSDPTEMRFDSRTHAIFFNIVLVDLLSATDIDKAAPIKPRPYLTALREIIDTPHFNIGGSIELLGETTVQFVAWLRTEITLDKVWLPTISTETDLKLTRLELLKVGGNICRHNVLRAVGIAKRVQKILANSGVAIDVDRSLLALSDVNQWFHNHVFQYHSSTIAEFLNNIRWGIFEYLQPEYRRSFVRDTENHPLGYKYTYPNEVTSEFGKECYWDLLNEVRIPPYMRRFQVTEWVKRRY